MTVIIEDTRSEAVWTVDNVPLGIAVPGSIAHQIGHWLTETYETVFAPVDVAKFSKFGAVYPERGVEALQAVGPVTVQGQATLQAVVKGCVIPELLTDAANTAAVAASTDLWTTISADGWVNPARMTAMPDGTVKSCSEALTELQTVLTDTELPAVRRLLSTKLAPDHADPGAVLATALPVSEELLLSLSRRSVGKGSGEHGQRNQLPHHGSYCRGHAPQEPQCAGICGDRNVSDHGACGPCRGKCHGRNCAGVHYASCHSPNLALLYRRL